MEISYYYEQAVKALVENRFRGKSNFIAEVSDKPEADKIITLDISDEKALLDSLRGIGNFTPDAVINRIFDKFSNCSSEDIQPVLAELLNTYQETGQMIYPR